MTSIDALAEQPKPKPANTIGGQTVTTVSDTKFNYNMLIFGDYSAGKTRFAGSAIEVPDLSPVLFLDVEGGMLTLKTTYPGVHRVPITNPQQITDIWKDLRKMNHPYKTVVIDSLTELHKLIIRYIMIDVVNEDDERDEDVPSVREYLKATEQVRRLCRRYRDLPLNSVFTALLTEEVDDKKNKKYKKINLSKKLAGEVGGFFDEVFYIYVKEVNDQQKRLMLTTRTEEIGAKDRSNTLPKIVEDPTMQLVFEYFTGERTK